MKIFIKLLLFCFTFFQLSCQNDTESNSLNEKIAREWQLTKVSGGFVGINQVFNPNQITWSFNSITGTVSIINNTADESLYDFFETGVYNYQIETMLIEGELAEVLLIDNLEMGCISIVDHKLFLHQTYADGFQLEFIK